MKNIIIKEITKKVYFYFSWGYRYFSIGYFLCKKIYKISLNNEFRNKTIIPAYAEL
ncbi:MULTISPECIES: hypothetical protein [Clostridium]|uniref:Uncharacterized protein n=2 Tax=Clostridium TaxID=1485 RepID=A0A7Y3SXN5_9CLOT|nr:MULTISPECIES: hypothetical protein [Clostridium]MBU3075080.1 hypothetical protein [Clostridium estertheticum]MBU3102092.1 hypothetical protein [Clostridium sp. DSM 17811]MBU3157291.1 hypothetical protein [Clostridium estertheticum]MBU3165295.1 hypothetical protein [Clostridium estertheticum]MBU3173052.1 hypothetical protein [Clostridium estertheticum]